jgi:hypothetical protein
MALIALSRRSDARVFSALDEAAADEAATDDEVPAGTK